MAAAARIPDPRGVPFSPRRVRSAKFVFKTVKSEPRCYLKETSYCDGPAGFGGHCGGRKSLRKCEDGGSCVSGILMLSRHLGLTRQQAEPPQLDARAASPAPESRRSPSQSPVVDDVRAIPNVGRSFAKQTGALQGAPPPPAPAALRPLAQTGVMTMPHISCCNATYPEKSIAGRCAFGADQGSCPMPRCPVACGECKICPEMSSLPF